MTDKELMMRAAKAAGIELDVWRVMREDGEHVEALRYRGAPHSTFDPMNCSDDAFQVMVGAELKVMPGDKVVVEGHGIVFRYHFDGDRAAATRRAIVEVAACCA